MYDLIGLISTAHLLGQLLYREICDLETVPPLVKQNWKTWKLDKRNNRVKIPRSIRTRVEPVTVIDIQVFRDASILGCCETTYAVVHQPSSISQTLIPSKSKLSKSEIMTPCLELIAMDMSANFGTNIREALKNFNVRSVIGWTDSAAALH